ncbi:chemotaxis protein CheA [Xinfangfangia sp. CPCC 101601]|uniref:Chemotaxis protein CheA n=1 Tax=Pseudogemmobacter lacusdianii TaxID=3069608 RepID=A0ABU0VZ41_9RHOB|nr:chemotaxis protein CheA [Xinfangfangia sp. CPCC 101601]MDQ2067027.1 chemotaxis protein CheA [Xinfangfangia sp. CPCC 101601]
MATMNSIRDTFFEECEELLEALAEGLSLINEGLHDAETVNAVFRAVHSVKGGAGAFALDGLVAFAHRFETVLDGLRADRIELTAEVVHVLLRSADHLADQVEAARDGTEIAPDTTEGFIANLDAVLGGPPVTDPVADADPCFGFSAMPLDLGLDLPLPLPDGLTVPSEPKPDGPAQSAELLSPSNTASRGYRIHFRPYPTLYANGHDPALILSALSDLGQMEVALDLSALPDWTEFDPAASYLAWSVVLTSDEHETAVQEIFEFVDGFCDLEITPITEPEPMMQPSDLTTEVPHLSEKTTLLDATAAAITSALQDTINPPSATRAPAEAGLRKREAKLSEEETGDGRGPKPTLRVELERVDRLINAVGELIINQAMIEQSISILSLPADAEVITHVEDYRLLARDIQEAVMAIRAQPVKPLFQRMSRIVREAADATGKQARLISLGEATEVDKTVIERLADPLTHMIRNAVDHGLENVELRQSAGKDPEGTIRLQAAHRSGSVVITVRDDGAGLNRPKILEKAIARGLVSAEDELTDAEIDNLLFLPGFSTADRISNLSGRGVGLDVVRNAVTALGGRVSITSTPSEGTEFTITLPLTLAVMDGMVISVAGHTMVVPITSVIETIRPGPEDLHQLGTSESLLSMRGRFIPMIDVAASLGFPGRDPNQPPLLLLVETDSQTQCALVVDAVHDQRQVVIKGLESNYGTIPGVSAATVLGDGQIALILDADALTSNRAGAPVRATAA